MDSYFYKIVFPFRDEYKQFFIHTSNDLFASIDVDNFNIPLRLLTTLSKINEASELYYKNT